jgi:transcriptional antiterminator RfaH
MYLASTLLVDASISHQHFFSFLSSQATLSGDVAMNVNELYDAPSWYVIRTGSRQEERAISNLAAWRVETFFPKLRVRRRNNFTGATNYVPGPMFPNYAFARFNARKALHQICYTRGVHSVVHFGGIPGRVDDSIIDLIRRQVGPDGLVRMGDDLKIGDSVKIKGGPLANFVGVFSARMDDRDRVVILLTTVSYQGRIVIEKELLEKDDCDQAMHFEANSI